MRYSAGLLAYPAFVLPSHPPAGGQWSVERKLSMLLRVGITVAGTAPDLIFIVPVFPFNLLMLLAAEEPRIRYKLTRQFDKCKKKMIKFAAIG